MSADANMGSRIAWLPDLLYTGGVLNVARSEVSTVGNDNAAAAWDKFATLWMDIGASIHVIATKVLKSAASQTVTVPKVSDLTSKLSDALKAQSDAAAQAQSSKAAVNQAEQQLSEGQKTWNSVSEAAKTYALALRARLAVCEATLGS